MLERLGQRLRMYAEKDGRGYPDWALRYVPIAKRLERGNLTSKTILEIGANANGLARFLKAPGARIVALDVNLDSLREARATQNVLAVMADASALPFRDKTIDACVCADTYEHLPEDKRSLTGIEILRTLAGSGLAVVAFPSGANAEEAERRIRDAYRRYTGGTIHWLEEHNIAGLPDANTVMRELTVAAGNARHVTCEKNAPIALWVWTWSVLMCGWPGRGNALFQALLRFLTPFLCRVHFGNCYRIMIWIEANPA